MALLGYIVKKGVETATKKATILAVGSAAASVISAKSKCESAKEDSVVKNGVLYLKPTRSSEQYINENAEDVAKELLGAGFEHVVLRGVKKLGEWTAKKYGRIHSITINGKKEFLGIKRVPASTHIIIEYLDFKDGINPEIYQNIKRLKNGKVFSIEQLEEAPEITKIASSASKQFCPYCGQKIMSQDVKFCSSCGKEI